MEGTLLDKGRSPQMSVEENVISFHNGDTSVTFRFPKKMIALCGIGLGQKSGGGGPFERPCPVYSLSVKCRGG